jgi:hypothetical protein
MKIRNGFVSNSSSSSFCIYGSSYDLYDFVESCKLINESMKEEYEENGEWWEIKEKIEKDTGLEVHVHDESDALWIGRSWSSIGDDETGRELKDGVEKIMKEHFDEDECHTYEESWYG